MKRLLLYISVLLCLITSCKKNTVPDSNASYTIEGFLIHKYGEETSPVKNVKIALSFNNKEYTPNDPTTVTDTNGYFKITYIPSIHTKTGIGIYPVPRRYDCIYGDISFIHNLPNGKDLNLGTIYTN